MFLVTQITIALIGIMMATIAQILYKYIRHHQKHQSPLKTPKSPFKLPIIGHLYLLGRHQVPYQDFTELAKTYGHIYTLQLGAYKCVVVHGYNNIRDILITRGHHFDARPNFQRYHQLFDGNKDNSLAFCDWSLKHKARRNMLKPHTFPHSFSANFANLKQTITLNSAKLTSSIPPHTFVEIKPLILRTCANIFTQHFCSLNFTADNVQFNDMIELYDEIFYEVNQGYAADFLPFLLKPFHSKNLAKMANNAHRIREIVNATIIGERFERYDGETPTDYVDSLIKHVKQGHLPEMSWETALFALEDIIGGHSAIGNFLVKTLGFLANEAQVQARIQQELDEVLGGEKVEISDQSRLPYTEATVFEAMRMIASPIVPRVANSDTTINNYSIEEGTIIFLNNHELNMSEELWSEPGKFMPERFIRDGKLFNPSHFMPFGGGRRSCMGYKMVQLISFNLLASLMQEFTIEPEECQYRVPIGSLALPKITFKFKFLPRNEQ